MTAVKRMALALLTVFLCVALCSCDWSDNYRSQLEIFDGSLIEAGESTPYRIVLPTDATAELAIAARELAEQIATQTESSVTVRYEHEEDCYKGEACLVLLGCVERVEAEMRLFKRDDYVCRMNENREILIGGRSESATLAAIARFREEILPAASNLALMHENAGFTHLEEYAVEHFSLNGFELQEYRIVAEGEDNTLLSLARWLRDEIAEQSGYYLSVLDEESFDGNGRALILRIEPTHSTLGQACLMPTQNGLALQAEDSYGVSIAVSAFADELSEAVLDSSRTLELERERALPYEKGGWELAMLSAEHLLPTDELPVLRSILDLIATRDADCFFVEPVPQDLVRHFEENLTVRKVSSVDTGETDAVVCCQDKAERICLKTVDGSREDGLTVSVWQVGEGDDCLRFLLLGGRLMQDTELDPSEYLGEDASAVMIVAQVRTGEFSLSLSGARTYGLELLFEEHYQATPSAEEIDFFAYGDPNRIRVEVDERGDALGYRSVFVERRSAIGLS